MKLPALLLLLPLALAACTDPGGYSYASPYERQAQAEGQIRATEAARVERDAAAAKKAAEEAGKTENEIRRIMAPIYAKQTEMALESIALANRSAAATLDASIKAQANQDELNRIEIERLRRQEANAAITESIWSVAQPILITIILLAAAAALFFLPWRWVNHRIDQDSVMLLTDGRTSVITQLDRNGELKQIGAPVTIPGGNGKTEHEPRVITGTWSNGDTVRSVGPSGNVLVSIPQRPDRSTTGRALAFVQQAIRKAGPYQDAIPGWRAMGITSSEWQRDFEPLKAAGLVEKGEKDNDSYHLRLKGEYSSLYELEMALRTRSLVLRPVAPPPPQSWAGD